jgi:hypothetical protein
MHHDQHPSPERWEAALERALKNLPELEAPPTLMTNVMAQIRARAAQPWYRQTWWRWPMLLRVASAVAVLALLVLLPWFGGHCWETSVSPWLNRWHDVAQTVLGSLANAGEAMFHTWSGFGPGMLRWVLPFISLLLLAMYLACVGIGTFVYRTVRR